MPQHIPSTSDARTVNNSTRQSYRLLTDAEKAQVDIIKQRGAEFIAFLHEIGGTDPEAERMASRDVAQGRHVYRQQRAVTGLINKRTPPITHGRRGYKLTPAGEALWAAMREWRPDLYAQ